MTYFAVTRKQNWDPSLTMEQQPSWDEHAAFMDRLVEEGIILVGGPLEGEQKVLLIFDAQNVADVEERLAEDVWTKSGLLTTERIDRWVIRLGRIALRP